VILPFLNFSPHPQGFRKIAVSTCTCHPSCSPPLCPVCQPPRSAASLPQPSHNNSRGNHSFPAPVLKPLVHRRNDGTPCQKRHFLPQPRPGPIAVLLVPRDRLCLTTEVLTELTVGHDPAILIGQNLRTVNTNTLDHTLRSLAPLTRVYLPRPPPSPFMIQSLGRPNPIPILKTTHRPLVTRYHHYPPKTHRSRLNLLSRSRQSGPMSAKILMGSRCTGSQSSGI
jgi:hypothetical protein